MPEPIPSAATGPQAGPAPAAVELVGVGRAFGGLAVLDGVTLRIAPGERVALIGPSGAGKTTLLRVAGAALFPTSGAARVLGEEVHALPPARLRALRARVGTVYQQLHLVREASVLENVLLGRLGRRSLLQVALAPFRRAEREAVAEVLGRVGIADKLLERVDRLSGGEQQRVAVARVLWQAPDLWLADEPFSSVDPARSAAVVRLLVEAAAGRTLVLSTHQLEPVFPHFPRIVGLRAGRVLFDKPRGEVTPDDLALLYQPEVAAPSPEPRRLLAPLPTLALSELRVGASTSPGEVLLPRVLPAFAREWPGMRVRLQVKDTGQALEDLVQGRVDLALVGARQPHPALHYEDLAEDEIVLLASPGFPLPPGPLTPSQVARLPRVDREPGSGTQAVVAAQLEALGAPLDPAASVFEAGSAEALKRAVAGGAGVGFASRLSAAEELAAGQLVAVPVQSVRVPRRYYVAWRRDEELPGAARGLLAALRRHLSAPGAGR